MDAIRVLLVVRSPILRAAFARLLDAEPGIDLIGQVAGVEEIDRDIAHRHADVLVYSALVSGAPNSLDLVRELRRSHAAPMVVIAPVHDETPILKMLEVGVHALVAGHDSPEALVEAVRAVATTGEPWISPLLMGKVLRAGVGNGHELSERERQVLCRIASGEDTRRTAAALGLTEKSVRNHLSHAYKKLRVGSRAEALAWAWRNGLLDEDG